MSPLRSIFGPPSRTRRRTAMALRVQSLEDRTLLAGDVAAIVASGNLLLRGDDADNLVEVTSDQAGLVVRGLDGTTINGSTADFVAVENADTLAGNLVVHFGAGNDVLAVTGGLTITGDLRFGSGRGEDLIGLDQTTVGGDVSAYGHGVAGVHIETSSIGDDLRIHQGSADSVVVVRGSDVGDDFKLSSHAGANAVLVEQTDVGDDLRLWTHRGDDSILLQDAAIGDTLKVHTGPQADFLMFDGVSVGSRTKIRLNHGDDALVVTGASELGDSFRADGGHDEDAIDVSDDSLMDALQDVRRFELDSVEQQLVDDRLNAPETGVRTRAMDLWDFFADPGAEPSGPLTLSVEVSMESPVVGSSDTLITDQELFHLDVQTEPGAVVAVDRDGDGVFDDGAAVADSTGAAHVHVTLLHNDMNLGANALVVRATEGGDEATETVQVHYALGTVVRLATTAGTFDVELLNADAPVTVANFLNYANRYAGSIIHRSARTGGGDDFIIQGGGFEFDPELTPVLTDPPIAGEFDPSNSNLRGTLSMALPPGDPDGGTSQWFVNVADNAFLDEALHTVFGRVIGTGMDVVDAIHALNTFNLTGVYDNAALATVPLDDYAAFTQDITGQVSVGAGTTQVVGVGTSFSSELSPGAPLRIGSEEFVVVSIAGNTELTIDRTHPVGAAGVVAQTNAEPDRADFVELDGVSVLL